MHTTVLLLVLVFNLFFQLPANTSNVCSYSHHALTISPEDYFIKYGIQLKSSKDHTLRLHQSTTLTGTAIAITGKWVSSICPRCISTPQNTYHRLYYYYVYVKLETRYYIRLLLDLLRDLFSFFHRFEFVTKKFESRPNYEALNKPDHGKNINMIIDRLTSQHYDARIVQRRWVDDSFAFGDRLAIYLENQAKEWNNLIEYWNRTTTKHDEHQHNKNHKQKLDLLVLDHEWKMINQSMNQLYKRQYREIVDLQIARCTPAEYILVGIDWNNTSIFDQFCSYLNSIQSANLYDTQFIILQNLKVTHKDVYLKVYNSFTTLKSRHPQNRQLASFRTVSKIDIEEWKFELTLLLDKIWKDGPNQTLPLWFLKTSSYWEIIKLVYMYILDYIYEFFLVRLENYAAIQKKNLLLNLNLALEHLRNL